MNLDFLFSTSTFIWKFELQRDLMLLSTSVSESSPHKFGGRHAFGFYFRQPFTLPGIPAGFSAGRTKSSFKVNEIEGLLQERLDLHSIQIISYSLKIVLR